MAGILNLTTNTLTLGDISYDFLYDLILNYYIKIKIK